MLFADDLNAEFNNILNNALSLISPLTGSLDAGGFDITNLDEMEFDNAAADPTASTTPRVRNNAGTFKVRVQDARTNTTARPFGIIADTSGSPAASLGVGMLFEAESGDEAPSSFGAVDFVASDVGAGTEDTHFVIMQRVAGVALAEKVRLVSTVGAGSMYPVTIVRKSADNAAVNSSTTLINDTHLLAALVANEVVQFECVIHHVGNNTADFKFGFTVPAAATILWNMTANRVVAGTVDIEDAVATSGGTLSTDASTTVRTVVAMGIVVNGANAGNLQLQWAQNTSTAVDTIVRANSYLIVRRIA